MTANKNCENCKHSERNIGYPPNPKVVCRKRRFESLNASKRHLEEMQNISYRLVSKKCCDLRDYLKDGIKVSWEVEKVKTSNKNLQKAYDAALKLSENIEEACDFDKKYYNDLMTALRNLMKEQK